MPCHKALALPNRDGLGKAHEAIDSVGVFQERPPSQGGKSAEHSGAKHFGRVPIGHRFGRSQLRIFARRRCRARPNTSIHPLLQQLPSRPAPLILSAPIGTSVAFRHAPHAVAASRRNTLGWREKMAPISFMFFLPQSAEGLASRGGSTAH